MSSSSIFFIQGIFQLTACSYPHVLPTQLRHDVSTMRGRKSCNKPLAYSPRTSPYIASLQLFGGYRGASWIAHIALDRSNQYFLRVQLRQHWDRGSLSGATVQLVYKGHHRRPAWHRRFTHAPTSRLTEGQTCDRG
jgi:hypothetical protein